MLFILQDGGTALIAASGEGHLSVVQLLIDRQANVNVKKKVCCLIPAFCYNAVTCAPNVEFRLWCFAAFPQGRCVCVRAHACVHMYMCVCECASVHVCVFVHLST